MVYSYGIYGTNNKPYNEYHQFGKLKGKIIDCISGYVNRNSLIEKLIDEMFGIEHKDIYYPVNYGYVPGIVAPDGEEQDAYILGVDRPLDEFTGRVIAVIHRFDDT